MRDRMHMAGRTAAVGCAVVLGTMLFQPSAYADPTPTTSADAKALVDTLTKQQQAAEDQYNAVNANYTKTQAVLDQRTAQISTQADKVDKLRASLASMALSRYQNRGQETTQALLVGNADDVMRRLTTINHVDGSLNTQLQDLQTENGYLTELNRQQGIDAAKSKAEMDQLGDLDKDAKDKLARAQALLNQLTEADRKAYEEAQAQKAAAAAAANAYTAQTNTKPTVQTASAQTAPAPAAPAAAAAVVSGSAPAPSSNGGLRSSVNARGNVYQGGSCVWYAYAARASLGAPVGSNWGNANQWPYAAAAEGFRVDHSPQAGAVFITSAFGADPVYGHAGVVDSVNPDGSFNVSEMHFPILYVRTTRTLPAYAAASFTFIH